MGNGFCPAAVEAFISPRLFIAEMTSVPRPEWGGNIFVIWETTNLQAHFRFRMYPLARFLIHGLFSRGRPERVSFFNPRYGSSRLVRAASVHNLRNIVVKKAPLGILALVPFDHLLALLLAVGFERAKRRPP